METVNKIVVFEAMEANLIKFKEKFKDIVYDLDTDDDMDQAKADKHSISKVRGKLASSIELRFIKKLKNVLCLVI